MWLFITFVAIIDVAFVYLFDGYFEDYELNPLALFLYDRWGICSLVFLRMGSVLGSWRLILFVEQKFSRKKAFVGTCIIAFIHLIFVLYFGFGLCGV